MFSLTQVLDPNSWSPDGVVVDPWYRNPDGSFCVYSDARIQADVMVRYHEGNPVTIELLEFGHA